MLFHSFGDFYITQAWDFFQKHLKQFTNPNFWMVKYIPCDIQSIHISQMFMVVDFKKAFQILKQIFLFHSHLELFFLRYIKFYYIKFDSFMSSLLQGSQQNVSEGICPSRMKKVWKSPALWFLIFRYSVLIWTNLRNVRYYCQRFYSQSLCASVSALCHSKTSGSILFNLITRRRKKSTKIDTRSPWSFHNVLVSSSQHYKGSLRRTLNH